MQGAAVYDRKHDWQGLQRYATSWTQSAPNDANAWFCLGYSYGPAALNQPASARPAFERAAHLDPNHPLVWKALGDTYLILKLPQNAADALSRAVRQKPQQPSYWNDLAVAYSQLGQWNQALNALDQEQKNAAAQEGSYGWYTLGNGYQQLKHQQAAIAAYQRALRINPKFSYAWNNLGISLEAVGDNQNALACYQRASALGDSFGARNYGGLKQNLSAAASQRQAGSGGGLGATAARLNGARAAIAHQWWTNHQ